MDGVKIKPQVTSASQELSKYTIPEGGGAGTGLVDSTNIAWTASNQIPANHAAGATGSAGGHGRSQSIGIDKAGPSSPNGGKAGQESSRTDFHPPLLRKDSSQLPSFQSLISSVDDPNDKNPIPPIAYSTENNPHAANSSPIRKQHICYACKKSFPSKNSLSKHKQIHGERSHICIDCNAKFHTKKDLTRHRDTVHGENSASYVCPVPECARSSQKKAFSRRDNLRQHILQLHDKKYLDEIKNPQGSSTQSEKNASRSPEGEDSPFSDDNLTQTIDEVIEEPQLERIEVRTPIQIVMGEDDLEEEPTPVNLNVINEKGKGKGSEYTLQAPTIAQSPHDESKDVVMLTPRLIVEDYGTVPEQEPLPESQSGHIFPAAQETANVVAQTDGQDIDENFVINFLDGVDAAELEKAAKLSYDGLQRRFPSITSQRNLDCLKFALTGFAVGFSRGVQLAQAKLSEISGFSGPTINTRGTLSLLSPSQASDVKSNLSPLTPTSITSPTNRLNSDSSGAAFFGPTQQNIPRNEAAGFVIRSNNNAGQDIMADTGSKADEVRPPLRSVANDADTPVETHKCTNSKCGKVFSKKSEWKKHMQRHRRPFFCTFQWEERSEVQRFGSKDDWRRHEEHRHYQSEFYKCPGGPHDSCRGAWAVKSDFEKHLNDHHKPVITGWTLPDGSINEDAKKDFLQKHHNGTDYVEDNFWCGFCAKLIPIPPEMKGRRGKEIRVNHVADHFHKEQKDIRLWVKYTECNLAEISKALENARTRFERDADADVEVPDPQRQLPPIKEIFGPSGEPFRAASLGPSPVTPDFWICCECQQLAQNRPNFVYMMNLGKEEECSSTEHRPHTRCPRCSGIARSQYT
ncbi:hypothetical protein AA313_de0203066 [Arthrobotrys entomopaga]|nr:hypothetical protein AA313_de0203066 [Arthrobotrys entomopaga]